MILDRLHKYKNCRMHTGMRQFCISDTERIHAPTREEELK